MTDWTIRIARLADQLQAAGELRSAAWRTAFCKVPRHQLVPRFYEPDGAGGWQQVNGEDPGKRDRWLDAVYSDTTLVTLLLDIPLPAEWGGGVHQVPVSSTTLPSLMMRMLEALDVHDGHRVLEIGTGTGYNAALLAARLGDQQVASVDLRPEAVAAAQERLAGIGYHPHLSAVDGALGLDKLAPYDRIIATCATRYIPDPWIEQLKPGGMMLVDLEGSTTAGNLAALWRTSDSPTVVGRFCRQRATFMPMAHQLTMELDGHSPANLGKGAERTTTTAPEVLHRRDLVTSFLAQLYLPAGTTLGQSGTGSRTATRLVAPDGSVAQVTDQPDEGRHRVIEAGPDQLWLHVEQAVATWEQLGRPAWDHFGLTASPDRQYVWYDRPDGQYTWPLDQTGLA